MKINLEFDSVEELNSFIQNYQSSPLTQPTFKEPVRDSIRKGKRYTQFELDKIVEWYNKNFTSRQIAKSLQRHPKAINGVIHRFYQKGLLQLKRPNRAKNLN